jgi:uncharacterized protein YecE (DUF72 family)
MPEVRIGCSGFNYRHWKGVFYPEKLPQKKWFSYYWTVFSCVELNVTFYRLPRPETFDLWRDETPDDFAFAVKGSRYITHIKRLHDPEEPLERFFSGALRLREKLRVILWQFPPNFPADIDRLRHFLERLRPYGVRSTFEFRDESWHTDETVALCREYGVSLCMAEWPPFNDDLPATAEFVYIRRHGHTGEPFGLFLPNHLEKDASRIRRCISEGSDVYVFFNNDAGGAAPQNAVELRAILGISR